MMLLYSTSDSLTFWFINIFVKRTAQDILIIYVFLIKIFGKYNIQVFNKRIK